MKRWLAALAVVFLLAGCSTNSAAPSDALEHVERLTIAICRERSIELPLVEEFENRTGIWVDMLEGNCSEVLEMAKNGQCDLVMGLGADSLEANRDLFSVLENVPDFPGSPVSNHCAIISLNSLVIVYNPKLVRNHLPDSFACLREPIWQGQIAFASPDKCDTSATVLSVICSNMNEPERIAFLTDFRNNIGVETDSCMDAISRVAQGLACLTIVSSDRVADAGELLLESVTPSEGCYCVPSAAAIPRTAARVENAKKMILFLCSSDAQAYISEYMGHGSISAPLPENAIRYNARTGGQRLWSVLSTWNSLGRDEA